MATMIETAQTPKEAPQHKSGAAASTLTLESSERLSSGISLHTFSASNNCLELLHPSGQLDLLFKEDLDPTRPARVESDRQLTFTAAYLKRGDHDGNHQIMILARNGRVTQLLGLPRLQGPLQAEIISSGGGFSDETLNSLEGAICVASGTGLAPFLAMASQKCPIKGAHLVWTINGNDFGAVEFLINSGMLKPEHWASVKVFVTSGEEAFGLIAGKAQSWWQNRFTELQGKLEGKVKFACGRMSQDDLLNTQQESISQVLFCGNKSLEWQVKMWFLSKAPVHTTSIV
ncbi:hypothetical protein CC79DRAFT_1391792 [Sarocladium strictum]